MKAQNIRSLSSYLTRPVKVNKDQVAACLADILVVHIVQEAAAA